MLLFVEPNASCPGWTLQAKNGSTASFWILVALFTAAPTIWLCYTVLRWNEKFSLKFYDSIAYANRHSGGLDSWVSRTPAVRTISTSNKFFSWTQTAFFFASVSDGV